ncbi:MAG: metalloregulator ArsR/SmtB family transcription factor [Anaerolinea sp.]|nr:metalloregulator ArsR/SmtB family transcription factor [Anaerolinea sp.]MCC6974526.1 metalloregulator ArsR/SmtB family transcription factor [Anaerolineae bacterium]
MTIKLGGDTMDIGQREDMLYLLKTFADEQRLKLLVLLNTKEYNVTEMAKALELSEPTISHHLTRMHAVGLLRLRMDGNQRFYSLNPDRLAVFKKYMAEIEVAPVQTPAKVSDNAWIEALPWSEEDKKVLRDYTFNGRIPNLPNKEKRFLVVLRWLATKFEPGVRYAEKQVNTILSAVNEDYALLRRSLVEYGFMRRERGGGDYWLVPEEETIPSGQ